MLEVVFFLGSYLSSPRITSPSLPEPFKVYREPFTRKSLHWDSSVSNSLLSKNVNFQPEQEQLIFGYEIFFNWQVLLSAFS